MRARRIVGVAILLAAAAAGPGCQRAFIREVGVTVSPFSFGAMDLDPLNAGWGVTLTAKGPDLSGADAGADRPGKKAEFLAWERRFFGPAFRFSYTRHDQEAASGGADCFRLAGLLEWDIQTPLPWLALAGGAGVGAHYVNFSPPRGDRFGGGVSLVGGLVFLPEKPYHIILEAQCDFWYGDAGTWNLFAGVALGGAFVMEF